MPKVSVVMIIHNGERFLSETLDSILGQSFREFELIAIDDGSTDKTLDILTSYQQVDSRLIVRHQALNRGIPASRNLACHLASGDYVAVADADDISLAKRLACQVDFLDHHPDISVVGSRCDIIDESGNQLVRVEVPSEPALIQWALIFSNVFVHSTVMMRRSVLMAEGFYSEKYPVAEDYDLFSRLSLKYKLANISEVLVQYRTSSDNTSSRKTSEIEDYSIRIVQQLSHQYLGSPVSVEEASALRTLGLHRAFQDIEQIKRANSSLGRLYSAFMAASHLSPDEARLITEDAAMKYHALALRARRLSRTYAIRLIWNGARLDPRSIVKLAVLLRGKIARR